MPLFVSLSNWTDQGVRNAKGSVERAKNFIAMAEKAGCKVHHFVYTMGPYDMVTIFEAPNGQTASAMVMAVATLGNVRTVSMPAYSMDEMAGVFSKLP